MIIRSISDVNPRSPVAIRASISMILLAATHQWAFPFAAAHPKVTEKGDMGKKGLEKGGHGKRGTCTAAMTRRRAHPARRWAAGPAAADRQGGRSRPVAVSRALTQAAPPSGRPVRLARLKARLASWATSTSANPAMPSPGRAKSGASASRGSGRPLMGARTPDQRQSLAPSPGIDANMPGAGVPVILIPGKAGETIPAGIACPTLALVDLGRVAHASWRRPRRETEARAAWRSGGRGLVSGARPTPPRRPRREPWSSDETRRHGRRRGKRSVAAGWRAG